MTVDKYIRVVQALKAQFQTGQHFHCTLAVKGGNILAIGMNDYQVEHPLKKFGKYLQRKDDNRKVYKPRLHSEIACLKQILHRDDLHKITLINIRIDNQNNLANAEPCDNCKRVLSNYKFKRIYFTINNKTLGRWLSDK